MSFAGYNLFGSTKNPVDEITIDVNVDKIDYKIIFKKVGLLNFSEILTNEGIDQKKKNFVEKLIKDILLSSKDRIRFGSNRMVLNTDNNSIIHNNDGSNIYKGFFTSAQITESGLYLLVLNMNKYVSGKTMYDKIRQIKSDNRKDSQEEIRQKIEEYIEEHKTVLATYGSIRAYRIEYIDFEKNPDNTSFNLKTKDGMMKTISIYNYYMQQYKICIKDSVKQIDSFWILREQMFINQGIFGKYFDWDTGKLLLDKNLVTYVYTISNICSSKHFVQMCKYQ
jgi:hypothetical protein